MRIEYASYAQMKYACKHWHYSKSVPTGKTVKFAVYEDDRFRGVVVYGSGSNNRIGIPYGLKQGEAVELVRVALRSHKTSVTRIIAITLKMLRKDFPGVKLVISYADIDQNHLGKIYQAGNWVYEGVKDRGGKGAFIIHGKKIHSRSLNAKFGTGSQRISWVRENLDPNADFFVTQGKHKYLYALDKTVKRNILEIGQEYPKAQPPAPDNASIV